MVHTIIQSDTRKSFVVDINQIDAEQSFDVYARGSVTIVLLGKVTGTRSFKMVIRLRQEEAVARIIGCIVTGERGSFHLTTLQLHESPRTTSNLLVKNVLLDDSYCRYEGTISVSHLAQQTDAYQRNENLLVSPLARCESKPTLEILANDVRCTHGATSGPIPENELWYLASRGINRKNADQLYISGFFSSAVQNISDTILRRKVERSIWELL